MIAAVRRSFPLLVRPPHIANVRIRRENLLECFRQPTDFPGCIDFPEPLSNDRLARLDKAKELIVVAILMPAPNCQRESVVLNTDQTTPVLRNDFICFDP